jgi:hypothetical protein
MTVTIQNLVGEEINRRSASGSSHYSAIQNILFSRLLSRNAKSRIYNVIMPVVVYCCETWTLTASAEHRLRVFENRVLRRMFEPKRDELTGGWRKLHNTELRDLYSWTSTIRIIKSRRLRLVDMDREWGRREKRKSYWKVSQKKLDH